MWYNEEGMRKQVGHLNGCIILTGQETRPSGRTLKAMYCRLVVFVFAVLNFWSWEMCSSLVESGHGKLFWGSIQKLASGRHYWQKALWVKSPHDSLRWMEGIGGEQDVHSRRCWQEDFQCYLMQISCVKACFDDPHVLQAAHADIEKDGVFPKDPDLSRFLTSPQAVAAALQLQHGFESQFGKRDCIDMIENYVTWGGDGGLTEATMRKPCRLPPRGVRCSATRAGALSTWRTEKRKKTWLFFVLTCFLDLSRYSFS